MINYEEFKKVELVTAVIKEVNDHPNADRLYVIKVEVADGNTKQVVAGIRQHYTKEELLNKQVVLVDNLEPVILRGVESQGMLLAASSEDQLCVLSLDKPIKPGSKIK